MTAADTPPRCHRNWQSVATLTLTGPEDCGVLGARRATELIALLAAIEQDPDARAVVVTGVGDVFATGRDDLLEVRRLVEALRDHPLPTFAAVQRACIGVGFAVALACERRFIASDAILCPTPGTQLHGVTGTLLTAAVGPDVAGRLLGMGALEPTELVRWGLEATLVSGSAVLSAAADAAARGQSSAASFLTVATASALPRGVRSRRGTDGPVNVRSAPAPGRSSGSESSR